MKKGQHSAYPCPRLDTPRGMTYASIWLASLLRCSLHSFSMVDSIIEAEKETSL